MRSSAWAGGTSRCCVSSAIGTCACQNIRFRRECVDRETNRAHLRDFNVVGRSFAATVLGAVRVSTSTTTLRPARSRPLSSTSFGRAMRTGTRWITLVKLPVAFSAGSSEKTEPEAGEIDCDRADDRLVVYRHRHGR